MTSQPRAIVLTPEGRGAVAVVLVEGAGAATTVGRFFHAASGKPLPEYPLGAIAFGRWLSTAGEELVVCRRSEERVEIHCHGGKAAVAAVLEALASAGCEAALWADWGAERGENRIQAQAIEALARATTERTAAILLDQYDGALGGEIQAVVRQLENDDDASLAEAQAALHALQAKATLGRHLTEPFRIVLAGRPNVGKSSLINALAGYRRSIVFDQPGTTRDVVTARAALDGWPVELADTAGIRDAEEPLERAGVLRAERSLAEADVRVLVFDRSCAWSFEDQALLQTCPDAVVVHNKCDLPAVDASLRPAGIETGATTASGIDRLIQAIVARLAPELPAPGEAVPFDESHFQALGRAAEALARRDRPTAAAALHALLSA